MISDFPGFPTTSSYLHNNKQKMNKAMKPYKNIIIFRKTNKARPDLWYSSLLPNIQKEKSPRIGMNQLWGFSQPLFTYPPLPADPSAPAGSLSQSRNRQRRAPRSSWRLREPQPRCRCKPARPRRRCGQPGSRPMWWPMRSPRRGRKKKAKWRVSPWISSWPLETLFGGEKRKPCRRWFCRVSSWGAIQIRTGE